MNEEKEMTVFEVLNKIQVELKAPKNQRNTFGNYNYRSCEDILEAVKPLLSGSVVVISDEIVFIGNRYYIKATATITYDGQSISCSAYAREDESQKGMSASQLTGATSSYARKYCANGLFLIDDTKDADSTNKHDKEEKKEPAKPPKQENKPVTTGTMTDKQSDFIIKIGTGLKDPYSPLSKAEVIELVRWKAQRLGVEPKSRAVADAFLPRRDETIKPWEKFAGVFDEWMDWKQNQAGDEIPIFDENGSEVRV